MQTLSILITNISKQTSMFFLFSNNHLNDIIGLGFDLRDEEVLAHFITLLKTISFKLDRDTIQFFFQVDSNNRCALPPLACGHCPHGCMHSCISNTATLTCIRLRAACMSGTLSRCMWRHRSACGSHTLCSMRAHPTRPLCRQLR